jgi:CheY-like chemotaxis protein
MQDKSGSILLVKEDEIDAESFMRTFHHHKITNPLIHALDGHEALKYLRGEAGYGLLLFPCLIVLDLCLPRMNGFEFLNALRQDEKLKQSVVFVGITSASEAEKCALYDLQVAGYIKKESTNQYCLAVLDLIDVYQQYIQLPLK